MKGQAKPAGNVDPEVERLAKVISDAWDDYMHAERISEVPEAWVDGRVYKDGPMRRAAAVLADLRERYVLVPREGADVEWQRLGGQMAARVIGPWEPADAPLSAQNGPDDSQGHPDRDDA